MYINIFSIVTRKIAIAYVKKRARWTGDKLGKVETEFSRYFENDRGIKTPCKFRPEIKIAFLRLTGVLYLYIYIYIWRRAIRIRHNNAKE